MTDEAAKALLARLQSRWPDEDCRQATTLIERLGREVEGLQAEVIRLRETADQLDGFLTASQADRDGLEADALRLREALEKTVFALEVTDACLRSWNAHGGPADVEGILAVARTALKEPEHGR